MFDYVDSSILGGLCIASQNISDNDNRKSVISSCDVCCLYPYIMTQTLPGMVLVGGILKGGMLVEGC